MTFMEVARDLVLCVLIFFGVIGLASAIAWRIARSMWDID